jgi:hypothetical protein
VYLGGPPGAKALMAVSVAVKPDVRVGPPVKLVDWPATWAPYCAFALGGQRAIGVIATADVPVLPGIRVVRNWFLELK